MGSGGPQRRASSPAHLNPGLIPQLQDKGYILPTSSALSCISRFLATERVQELTHLHLGLCCLLPCSPTLSLPCDQLPYAAALSSTASLLP